MLIARLLPLLDRYSLGFDLVAGPDDTVTLTVIPRNAEGKTHRPETGEIRPISLTASASEIDAELAKGETGALGQLVTSRKALADQIAEQREAAEAARAASAEAAKAKAAAAPARAQAAGGSSPAPAPAALPDAATPEEPASLW